MQREKQTISGPLLEADFFPIMSDGRRIPTRAPKQMESSEAQKRYNRLMAIKKFIRLVNANFDNTDYLMHPTYAPASAPQNEQQARKDIVNYIRRVRYAREREAAKTAKKLNEARKILEAMPDSEVAQELTHELSKKLAKLREPFKYIYVIEKEIYKRGRYAGLVNYHFHMFISGGLSQADMEEIWNDGMRANCNRYQPEKFGHEAAALYMSKDPQGTHRFCYSRNLEQPTTPPPIDGETSGAEVEDMARNRIDDAKFWEKRYPGYRFVRCFARFNEYNSRWYVSAIMYRSDQPLPRPKVWQVDEWITSDRT